jgi:hypothetical protein
MPSDTSVIETTALSKRYGGVVALDDLDRHVASGEMFRFLGPNGGGQIIPRPRLEAVRTPVRTSVPAFKFAPSTMTDDPNSKDAAADESDRINRRLDRFLDFLFTYLP